MLYYRMTGYGNLKFFCKLYRIPYYKEQIENIAREFGLEKWLNQLVENYSSGMKTKLALCRTLILKPKILLLDEPTLGLDVKSNNLIVNKLKNLKKTIIITSHDMNSMDKLCDHIGFINNGEIVKIGNKEDIKRLMQTQINIEIKINKNINQLKSELKDIDYLTEIIEKKEGFIISLKNRENYQNLLQLLSKYKILMVKEHDKTLEDLFLKLFNL